MVTSNQLELDLEDTIADYRATSSQILANGTVLAAYNSSWPCPLGWNNSMLPLIADLPPTLQERVICSITAAVKYEVPANIVLAVAEQEAGEPGQWVPNTNGTHDVGPMQFNTSYLRELSAYGITPEDVAAAGCYSYELAAWRLRMHIRNDQGDIWTRAANYHSRTPQYNAIYREQLRRRGKKWGDWLRARFPKATQEYRVGDEGRKPVGKAKP